MPKKYKDCVRKTAAKGAKNPHAVCTAANAGNIKEYRKHESRRGSSSRAQPRSKKGRR